MCINPECDYFGSQYVPYSKSEKTNNNFYIYKWHSITSNYGSYHVCRHCGKTPNIYSNYAVAEEILNQITKGSEWCSDPVFIYGGRSRD